MNNNKYKNNIISDPLLENEGVLSVDVETLPQQVPKKFTSLDEKIIKSVSLYLQLLWSANPNGKTIKLFDVYNILNNVKYLFSTKYNTDNIYLIRHIASDLREIALFSGFKFKKYFKNIETERQDIKEMLGLASVILDYFGAVAHFNYTDGYNSFNKAQEINENASLVNFYAIDIPEDAQKYLEKEIFERIFEQISIIFVMNYYIVFSEFLFNEQE